MEVRPLRRVIRRVPLSAVSPSREQPRRRFLEESIASLAESIERDGLLSPPMVRPCPGGYELIAGERRLRALKKLGAVSVDALVVEATDSEAAILSLVENLQREELHYLDEAEACRRLIQQHGLTQREIAERLGRSQSAVANLLRLLALPDAVRDALRDAPLGERHARALLRLPNESEQLALATRAAEEGMSVRTLEAVIDRGERSVPRPLHIYCRDQRMFVNALLATVRSLNRAGVKAVSRILEKPDSVEVIVTLPRLP
jgi:ParB family transcriptional regulator, chromosome partitioning protein